MSKQYDYKEVAEALRETGGVVTRAAEIVGCHPDTIYNYRDEYKTVAKALEEGRRKSYAKAENKLMEKVEDGEQWAIERLLEVFGETVNDGLNWTEKQEVLHGNEGEEALKMHFVDPAGVELDDDE